jgi:NTE family protein
MMTGASDTAFAVVFTLFVVASLVLIVLVMRFILQRASAGRSSWLSDEEGGLDGEGGGGDLEEGDEEDRLPFTALVLAGGGTRGAVQIGMLQVLTEHGFVPDRIYGCSVGAMNGVAFAADPTRRGVERMTEIWTGLTRDAVYPQGRLHGPWLYVRQRDSVYPNDGLRKVIEEGIGLERLEDSAIPVEVVATSLTDGQERWFTYGPAVEAILASSAIPTIFPPIDIDGERFIDGAVVDNVPVRRAIDCGATRIVVLLCGPPLYSPVPTRRPVEAMLDALLISIHARFAREMAQLPAGVEVIVCSGSESRTREFDDFSTTEALIAEGRKEAEEVIRRYGLDRLGPALSEGSNGPGGPNAPGGPDGSDNGASPGHPAPAGADGLAGTGTPSAPASFTESPLSHPDPGT